MIELRDVYQKFASQNTGLLFEGVNCLIGKGEFVIVTGSSGSGKSTLLKMIAAQKTPSRGKVLVRSKDTSTLHPSELPYFNRQFGIIDSKLELLFEQSVIENVALPLVLRSASAQEIKSKALSCLELCGLASKARTSCQNLSGFEQQLVQVARAMVAAPPIILCDAAFNELEDQESRAITELLCAARSYGATVIVATARPDLFSKKQRRQLTIENRRLHEFAVTKYPTIH